MKRAMKTRLALLGCLLLGLAACSRSGAAEPSYAPGLDEIMTLTQTRHVKLWLAGSAENWPLARYELDKLQEGIGDAARLHPRHKGSATPIPQLIDSTMRAPLTQLEGAVKAESRERFVKAFDALTQGCNGCHEATRFGFNVVTRPVGNPYANQAFRPVR
jgi:hypothetical protein